MGSRSHPHELKLHSQSPCRGLCLLQHVLRRALAESAGMPEGSDARDRGNRFLEQLQTLGNQLRAEEGQPCDVSTLARKARHEPVSDRIAHSLRDNGDHGGRLLGGAGRGRIRRDDEVDLETGQLGRQTRQSLDLPFRRSVLNDDVLTLQIAAFAQSLPEGVERHPRLRRFKRTGHQDTYPCGFHRLLRLGGQRRGEDRSAASQEATTRDHWIKGRVTGTLSPAGREDQGEGFEKIRVHLITSSTRSSTGGGIVRPRALAVLRLLTSSNFVGCSTGRSPGLALLRISST